MAHNSEAQQRYISETYEQQDRFSRTEYNHIEATTTTTNSYQQYQGQPLMYNNSMNSNMSPQRVVMPSQPSTPQPTNTNNNSPLLEHPPSTTSNDDENDLTYTPNSPSPAEKFNNTQSPYPITKDRKSSLIHETCPSFGPTEYAHNIVSMDRHTTIDVRLHTKIDRGFFLADNDWTCYRRNYFQVSGSFSLEGVGILYEGQEIPCLAKDHTGHLEEIQCFMLGVKARLSDCDKAIQLIQHTPKRDKGPQTTPSPKLIRPGGNISFSSVGSSMSIVTFERLQFKTATANNGKRRAAQQYYVIVIELLAKLRNGNVLTVATAKSAPLVVRGRSPGHYAESDSGTTRQHRHSSVSTGGPISSVIQQHHASHLPYHRPSLIHSSNSYSSNTSNGLFQPGTPTTNHSTTTTPSNEYMPYDYHSVPPNYNYGHMSQPHSYPSPAIPMMQHHYLPDRSHSLPDTSYPHQNDNHHDYEQQGKMEPPHSSPYYWQRQESRYEEHEYNNADNNNHHQNNRMRMPSNQSTSSNMENNGPYRETYYSHPYGHYTPHSAMNQNLPAPNAGQDHYYQPPPQQHYDWRPSNKMSMYTYNDSENTTPRQHEYERPQQSSPTHSPQILNRETATTIVK